MPNDSLEQQALDRVARMYSSYDRRAGRTAQSHSGRPAQTLNDQTPSDRPAGPDSIPSAEPSKTDNEAAADSPSGTGSPQPHAKASGFLGALMEDKEQSLIMLLLVILMKDGADLNMILALMYLLI